MLRKITSIILSFMMIFSISITGFANSNTKIQLSTERNISKGSLDKDADNNTAKNGGKVIIVDISRTNLENFNNIKFIRTKLKSSGYVALMNIRGDKGYDDKRNFATMGASTRANISSDLVLDFNDTVEGAKLYKSATGWKPGTINLVNINNVDFVNLTTGDYKSKIGYLGETMNANGKKISVIGNNDYYENGQMVKNRDFCLTFMDSKGRLFGGNTDDINKKDTNYPFGIATDYEKLKKETQKYYNESDLLYVNTGDTYRLDKYKMNLNEKTYKKMKFSIYNKISDYLDYVFSIAGKNDTVYVMSSYPSNLEYINNKKLTPIMRFDMSDGGFGLLNSATTRRDGIISNVDFGAEILNRFGLKNEEMIGKKLTSLEKNGNIDYLLKDFEKIVSISSIRMSVINIYVSLVSIVIIAAVISLWQKNRIPRRFRDRVIYTLKEASKLGLIMPLAFLSAPMLQSSSKPMISLSIVFFSITYYLVPKIIFKKNDMKQIGMYSLIMISVICLDAFFATPLMESNIMSYDPMVAARYYGIGNEYEGVVIGSAILGFSVILEYKKFPKWIIGILLMGVLFISAYPSMGANVGGAISGMIAFLVYILLINNVKIDIKKCVLILLATVLLVAGFAIADIVLNIGSHLGNFVNQIMVNGPMEIANVFLRKIEMNILLAQTTIWVNLLLVALLLLSIAIFRPGKFSGAIKNRYPYVYKGFLSIIVGCLVTLLVNDSGIISAATDSLYLIVPIVIIMVIEYKEKTESSME